MQKIKHIRPMWPKDWPIFYKIVTGLVLLVVSTLGITTYVNAVILQTELREQIGIEFATLAEAEMRHLADILSEQFTILQNITVLDQVRVDMAISNSRYVGDAGAIETQLLTIEQEWQTAADDSQLVRSRVNPAHSSLAFQLLTCQDTFPGHVEIVLTDGYGALLAATSRKPGYYYADKAWWQAAYNEGKGSFYVGQPQKDENSGYTVLQMAVPVFSEKGQVIGLVGTTFRMDALQRIVAGVQFGRTGRRIILTDADGLVLADSQLEHLGQLDQQIFPLFNQGALSGEKSWRELTDDSGEAVLAGYVRITDIQVERQSEAQAIDALGWFLFVQQAQSEAYAPVYSAIRTGRLAVAVFALLVAVSSFFVVRVLTAPFGDLTIAAQNMAAGDLSARALVRRRDETGELALAFNTMAEKLNDMVSTLERRVDERTRGLLAAAEVSRATTVLLDPDELLRQVVNLARDRFDLYYVGLFLLDEEQEFAVLHAGTGKAGRKMLANEHKSSVGGDSMIGQCVFRDEPRIALYVGGEAVRRDPYLPNTRSEMALPLRSRGRVIGAMTVQSTQEAAFDETDVAVLQTMADQVAVAIDNARLFAETQAALREMETTHQRYLQQEWREYHKVADLTWYETGTMSLAGQRVLPEVNQVVEQGQVAALDKLCVDADESDALGCSALAAPIMLRNELVGVLGVRDSGVRRWTEDEKVLIQAVADRMALAAENLRLVQGTQRRVAQEQLTREIIDKMRLAIDMDALMQTTIREAVAGLDVSDAFVQLTTLPFDEALQSIPSAASEHGRPGAMSEGNESEPEEHD